MVTVCSQFYNPPSTLYHIRTTVALVDGVRERGGGVGIDAGVARVGDVGVVLVAVLAVVVQAEDAAHAEAEKRRRLPLRVAKRPA